MLGGGLARRRPERVARWRPPERGVLSTACAAVDEADRDGDGEINEEEFLRIMKKTSLY